MMQVSMLDIMKAAKRIQPYAINTPFFLSKETSAYFGSEIWFKMESMQQTGSFKFRGALNNALSLSYQQLKKGLVASSSGNHAQAVAYAAQLTGTTAVVCVPDYTPETKKKGILQYGAELQVCGPSYYDAEDVAKEIAATSGRNFINSFEDPATVAGQGTVMMEVLDLEPDIDVVLVPTGGGGLLCGTAIAAKTINPACKVYGVQTYASSPWHASFQAGALNNNVPFLDSYAEGLAGKITWPTVELALNWVNGILLVEEQSIPKAIRWMAEHHHYMIEASAAVSLAVILENKYDFLHNKKIALIISGGNINLETFCQLASLPTMNH